MRYAANALEGDQATVDYPPISFDASPAEGVLTSCVRVLPVARAEIQLLKGVVEAEAEGLEIVVFRKLGKEELDSPHPLPAFELEIDVLDLWQCANADEAEHVWDFGLTLAMMSVSKRLLSVGL